MQGHRRSLISLGLAALLPVIVFVAVQVVYQSYQDRRQVESETLTRAKEAMLRIDAEVDNELTFLRLMASSGALLQPDFKDYYTRCQRAIRSMPHIKTMMLWDATTRQQIFDLRLPFDSQTKPAWPFEHVAFHAEQPIIDDITAELTQSRPMIVLHYPVVLDQQLRYIISVAVDPQVFQNILMSYAPQGSVGALVDRTGRFIARTLSFEDRVGTPATVFVRQALTTGPQGFYKGITYEGFENYTAFYKSPALGWSVHIAVDSSMINGSRLWSFTVAGLAALGTVLLTAVLVVLVLRDMEERRHADESLRQSQKMEAVGQLTGGIAHDFNNLLTAMIGGLDLIVQRTMGNDRVHKFAVNALAAAHRGAKLTSQLLAFSRHQSMLLTTIDMQALTDSMSELLSRAVGASIRLKLTIAAHARYVISDPTQLELALLNLAGNARDAMPNGGELSICTALADKEHVAGLAPRDYVQIEVSDTGSGMSEEVRRRAFEPFFTTKPIGAGTGLGLSQVFGVMKQSSGALYLASSPGNGTHVYLILPRGEAPPLSPHSISHDESQLQANGSASILVVDDDVQVRSVVTEVLRSRGYRVGEAENGERALSLMADEMPDLLLIDFAMPGLNGAEVAHRSRQRYPQLKIVMMSGYADTNAIAAAIGDVALLQKPFDSGPLLAVVAKVLNEHNIS